MDDDDDDDNDGHRPPPISRLGRGRDRRYRALTRPSRYSGRDRFKRLYKEIPVAVLLGRLIEHHGLTDDVRQRFVCIYWSEIVGERIAARTVPTSFADRVLHVSASSSPWVHELQFCKAQMIGDINGWIDANRVWLGPPPLVADIRFALGTRQREQLIDREQVQLLRQSHLQRTAPRPLAVPPVSSEADRAAICEETDTIVDPELREVIERVRTTWNR